MEPAGRRPLKVGLFLASFDQPWAAAPAPRWADLLAAARLAEEVGFDSVWLGDHLLVREPDEAPIGARGARPAAIAPQAAALGDRLSETRKRLNLTQAAAAEACDVPQQTYSRAERTGSASRENRRKLETWLAANQVEIQAWLSIRR